MKFGPARYAIRRLMKKSNRDIARLWGRNALGKPAGLLVDRTPKVFSLPDEDELEPEAVMASSIFEDDMEYLTFPVPATYEPLPSGSGDVTRPPDGMMLCDVYRFSSGGLRKIQSAEDVTDFSLVIGGVTGPGVEFLYLDEIENGAQSNWDHYIPVFRGNLTPRLPEETLRMLFEYGSPGHNEKSDYGNLGVSNNLPKLKSAL